VHLFFLFVSFLLVCMPLIMFLWYIWRSFDFVAHFMTDLLWYSGHYMDKFMHASYFGFLICCLTKVLLLLCNSLAMAKCDYVLILCRNGNSKICLCYIKHEMIELNLWSVQLNKRSNSIYWVTTSYYASWNNLIVNNVLHAFVQAFSEINWFVYSIVKEATEMLSEMNSLKAL